MIKKSNVPAVMTEQMIFKEQAKADMANGNPSYRRGEIPLSCLKSNIN